LEYQVKTLEQRKPEQQPPADCYKLPNRVAIHKTYLPKQKQEMTHDNITPTGTPPKKNPVKQRLENLPYLIKNILSIAMVIISFSHIGLVIAPAVSYEVPSPAPITGARQLYHHPGPATVGGVPTRAKLRIYKLNELEHRSDGSHCKKVKKKIRRMEYSFSDGKIKKENSYALSVTADECRPLMSSYIFSTRPVVARKCHWTTQNKLDWSYTWCNKWYTNEWEMANG
jgi:hypothetical protein